MSHRFIRLRLLLAFIASSPLSGAAHASAAPEPQKVDAAQTSAEAIVVATMTSYAADPPTPTSTSRPDDGPLAGTAEIDNVIAGEIFKPSGRYEFTPNLVLKGKLPGRLQIDLPGVSSFFYEHRSFSIEKGKTFLLLLTRGRKGEWQAADPLRPLIPLSKEMISLPSKSDAIDVLLKSADAPSMRELTWYLLEDVVDPRVALAAKRFEDDSDWQVRDHALTCLATNQDPTAIPKIAQLEREERGKANHNLHSIQGISCYETPAAIPLLNPLILSDSEWIRVNAILALNPLADESSLPFLIQALDRDDSQHFVPYSSYRILHRFAEGSVGPVHDQAYLLSHRDAEKQTLKDWWMREQRKSLPDTRPALLKKSDPVDR